jgi:hypothetical protein
MSDKIENFISSLSKRRTPSNSPEDLFEIKHTGEWNYQVEGGNTKVFIDGYRGRTILECKYINDPERSPYIPSSTIPDFLRRKILKQIRDEFQRIRNVIEDPKNPFDSLEVITNNSAAQLFFEELLKEFNLEYNVTLAE